MSSTAPNGAGVVRLRIGTFNFENLFDRAKALLVEDRVEGGAVLAAIGELQALLERDSYLEKLPDGREVRARIVELYDRLRAFVTIRVDRGGTRFFDNESSPPPKLKVVSSIRGRADWSGSVDFRKDSFGDAARENAMRVVQAVDADILCCVEVEGLTTLRRFATAAGRFGVAYPYAISIDGNDERGIDVGVLSRHPIVAVETHQFDEDAGGRVFSRDCLEVTIDVPQVGAVTVLCNHLKSISGSGMPSELADSVRARQVNRLLGILAARDLANERLVLLGDLNDFRGRVRAGAAQQFILRGLVEHPQLVDVMARAVADDAQRWTWTGIIDGVRTRNRLDYLLATRALADHLHEARNERRGIFEPPPGFGEAPFETVTDALSAASDHAAVVAEFRLPT